jgi:hypothetical protein
MKYMLLVCTEKDVELDPAERARIPTDTDAWVKEMDGRGVRLLGDRLAAISEATTVRVRDGEVLIADGPFAETKEQIAGFDILDQHDVALRGLDVRGHCAFLCLQTRSRAPRRRRRR